MSSDKFTFRDFFVFFLSGVSAVFCFIITQYDTIIFEINKPENVDMKNFVKEYSTVFSLLSIPGMYMLGHFIHGCDDLVNFWTKLIRGRKKTRKPKCLIFHGPHLIAYENRINGYLERREEDVNEFWQKFAYLQINNQAQNADYWYVMNELFKGVTLTCLIFGFYGLFTDGKNEGYMFLFVFVFWERAHYFAKRFYMNVTKVYLALQKEMPKSDEHKGG